jgi:hypothetical protein
VTTSFGQTHDVKHLLVLDSSSCVRRAAGSRRTIVSLAWRRCNDRVDDMKRGNV